MRKRWMVVVLVIAVVIGHWLLMGLGATTVKMLSDVGSIVVI